MFVGHYGVGFAAKRFAPKTSLGILIGAATFLDIPRAIAVVLGIESTQIDSHTTYLPGCPNSDAIFHSLAGSIILAAIFCSLYWWKSRDLNSALVVAAVLFSHWPLDLLIYALPIYPAGSTSLDLGLLSSATSRLIVEGLLLVLGMWLYLTTMKRNNGVGRYGFASFLILVGVAYVASITQQYQFNESLVGQFSVLTLVLPIWAQWFDEHRHQEKAERPAWLKKLIVVIPQFRQNVDLPSELLPLRHRYHPGKGRQMVNGAVKDEEPPDSPTDVHSKQEIVRPVERAKSWFSVPIALMLLTVLVVTAFAVYSLLRIVPPDAKRKTHSAQATPERVIAQAIEKKPGNIREALRESIRISKDVEQILREGWEARNVGGAIAVAASNWDSYARSRSYKSVAQLGFQRVNNWDALVNRVLANEINIDHIELTPMPDATGKFKKFRVSVTLTNRMPEAIEYYISKGQILEVQDSSPVWEKDYTNELLPTKPPQGVTKSKETPPYVIPPADTETIYFEAFCVDEGLALPYGPANLTIFELTDLRFTSPNELHRSIRSIRSGTKLGEGNATPFGTRKEASVAIRSITELKRIQSKLRRRDYENR